MLSGREVYMAVRLIVAMIAGVVLTLVTGNPLFLGLAVLAFIAVAFLVWRRGSVYEPRWERLVDEGMAQGGKGDWEAATTTFQTAMKKCRSNAERRQASTQIGQYLFKNDRPGEAEPFLRQAVNLSTAVLGPTPAQTAAPRDPLSDLYLKSGQARLAAQLQGRAVAAAVQRGAAPHGAADAEARYAEILQRSGDPEAAAAQYQKALQTIEATKSDTPA